MYDIVEIRVQAGKGGDGVVIFRHEKFVPFGGPDGGDGGNGGNVYLSADSSVTDLKAFRSRGLYRAGDGGAGARQKRHGKNGEALVIPVPPGTTVYEDDGGQKKLLADLGQAGERVLAAGGGRGGWGNVRYATPTNQTPRLAQAGEEGEKKDLVFELRLIADAGIIGLPNAGKSSLLAAASRARPEIADYPFTTKEPQLGVVEVGNETFVLAEIPGLIEGASLGRGLGHDFLRHSTRTRVFVHLVDGSAEAPVVGMIKVNNELHLYDAALARKPQIVVVNKVDLPQVRERAPVILEEFSRAGAGVRFVSALSGEGVTEVMKATLELLHGQPVEAARPEHIRVFRPAPRRPTATVEKEGELFLIRSLELERIAARVDLADPVVMRQFREYVTRRGISRLLEKAGIKGGDRIRCGDAEWYW